MPRERTPNKRIDKINLPTLNDWFSREIIVVDSSYQRELVWTLYKKQLLIDSIIRDFDVPKIYLVEDEDTQGLYRLVDGQQRVEAICQYLNDSFKLKDDFDPYRFNSQDYEIKDKSFTQLDLVLQDQLNGRSLDVVYMSDYNRDQEKDVFFRMQQGEPLNAAEKRRGILGNCSDEIVKLSEHEIFDETLGITGFSRKRFSFQDVSAKVFHQFYKDEICSISASKIEETYKLNADIDTNNSKLAKVRTSFNLIKDAFQGREIRLKKYALIRLSFLFNEMRTEYDLRQRIDLVGNAYIKFEEERALDAEKPPEDQNNLFITYANCTRGDSVQNQTHIHKTLKDYFIEQCDLTAKDNARNFTNNQRSVIFRRSYDENLEKHRCQADKKASWFDKNECLKDITMTNFETPFVPI